MIKKPQTTNTLSKSHTHIGKDSENTMSIYKYQLSPWWIKDLNIHGKLLLVNNVVKATR